MSRFDRREEACPRGMPGLLVSFASASQYIAYALCGLGRRIIRVESSSRHARLRQLSMPARICRLVWFGRTDPTSSLTGSHSPFILRTPHCDRAEATQQSRGGEPATALQPHVADASSEGGRGQAAVRSQWAAPAPRCCRAVTADTLLRRPVVGSSCRPPRPRRRRSVGGTFVGW